MKLLIEIPEEAKQAFDCAENNDIKGSFYDHGGVIGNAIKNGTPISDNATNGDVIMAMFPNAKIKHGAYGINGTPLICLSMGTRYDVHEMSFVEDFWNALYRKD